MITPKKIICVDPWPVYPIEQYTQIDSGPWGYLTTFSDGAFEFSQEKTPSQEEIISLWHRRLNIE